MAKDYCSINFVGLTHDHSHPRCQDDDTNENSDQDDGLCSAIAILKRHPMYDSLVLVKKYRRCLGGYSLEFPIDRVREPELAPTNESAHHQQHQQQVAQEELNAREESLASRAKCGRRRLVTRFLDGDDPMLRAAFLALRNSSSFSLASDQSADDQSRAEPSGTSSSAGPADGQQQQQQQQHHQRVSTDELVLPFMDQLDDLDEQCALVHVPINGLLDRLEGYTRNGVAVDARVYSFAMGLKTAERMMTTKAMKELQETPI
jgi:hypothetical protein